MVFMVYYYTIMVDCERGQKPVENRVLGTTGNGIASFRSRSFTAV